MLFISSVCMFPQRCVLSQGLNCQDGGLFALHYVVYLPVWNCHQAHLNMAVSLPHFFLPGI